MNQRSILQLQLLQLLPSPSSSSPKRGIQRPPMFIPSFSFLMVAVVVLRLVVIDRVIQEPFHWIPTRGSVTAFVVDVIPYSSRISTTTTTTTRRHHHHHHLLWTTHHKKNKNNKLSSVVMSQSYYCQSWSITTTIKLRRNTCLAAMKQNSRNSYNKNEQEEGEGESQLSRRQILELSLGTIGLSGSYLAAQEVTDTDYGLWGILPVGTYKSKPTICETIVPHSIWTCDQKFGILNVQVPLRMTIVKIQLPSSAKNDTIPPRMRIPKTQRYINDDKYCLLIYNPIAPTRQCVRMIQHIEAQEQCHVRHIVVGSVALEHKVYAASMGQQFRYSTLWLTPGQYTFPFTVPEVPYLGFPTGGRTKMIPYMNNNNNNNKNQNAKDTATVVDWPGYWDTNEIQSDILGPIISRDGAFSETVLYHRPTRTMIVTDTCVQITKDVPTIYQTDVKPILYHARDTITDIVTESPATLEKGWKRIVLFALYFMPSAIVIKDLSTAIRERRPDINPDFIGIYPWDWVGNEAASWEALTGSAANKPLVAPILQVLLLNRSPVEVLDFANRVATNWDIQRIIPSHFKNNLSLTGDEYRNAFLFLTADGVPSGYPKPLDADLQLLRDAEISLMDRGAIVPAPPRIGTPHTSRADIVAQTIYRCRSNVCAPKAES